MLDPKSVVENGLLRGPIQHHGL
uniref:Uncharacterized protein n=1 Tax=Anguilla anguilla TaxID=7936 RepID=A0A0E9UXA6_ANGAN